MPRYRLTCQKLGLDLHGVYRIFNESQIPIDLIIIKEVPWQIDLSCGCKCSCL